MVRRLILVVRHGDERDAEATGGQRLGVRVEADGEVERSSRRRSGQGRRTRRNRSGLSGQRRAAMTSDELEVESAALGYCRRLPVIARRDPHLVAAGAETVNERPEEEGVGRGGEVDPDHSTPPRMRATVPAT